MISPVKDELTAAIAADLGIKNLPLEEQQALIAQFGEVALKGDAVGSWEARREQA